MKLFDSFDDREKEIENAAGNIAFKVFWILILISLFIMISFDAESLAEYQKTSILFSVFILGMFVALSTKYYCCWINGTNKKLLVMKYTVSVISSILFFIVLLQVYDQIHDSLL